MEEKASKYCYDSGALKNKFGIMDEVLLNQIERNITTYRIS